MSDTPATVHFGIRLVVPAFGTAFALAMLMTNPTLVAEKRVLFTESKTRCLVTAVHILSIALGACSLLPAVAHLKTLFFRATRKFIRVAAFALVVLPHCERPIIAFVRLVLSACIFGAAGEIILRAFSA
jgi:hypothetical protein